MECHTFEPVKARSVLGTYYGGTWVRDYMALLRRYVPEDGIQINRIPKELWPVEPWQSFGAVIEIDARQ
jgi:hypothetical protein